MDRQRHVLREVLTFYLKNEIGKEQNSVTPAV